MVTRLCALKPAAGLITGPRRCWAQLPCGVAARRRRQHRSRTQRGAVGRRPTTTALWFPLAVAAQPFAAARGDVRAGPPPALTPTQPQPQHPALASCPPARPAAQQPRTRTHTAGAELDAAAEPQALGAGRPRLQPGPRFRGQRGLGRASVCGPRGASRFAGGAGLSARLHPFPPACAEIARCLCVCMCVRGSCVGACMRGASGAAL